MAIYDNLPYTNFHELNADWLLKQMKEAKAKIDEYQEILDQFEEDYQALLALASAMTATGNNVTVAGSLTAKGLIGNLTGNATNATHATNADHATTADSATNSNLAAAAAKTKLDTDLHTSTDANDFIPPTDGLYVYQVDALNSNVPRSQQGEAAVLLTIRYGTDHVLQVAWFYVNSQDLYYRQKYYSNWQGWYKITTTYESGI